VSPGNLYYIAGSFGNPGIVKVVSDQEADRNFFQSGIFLPFMT
jgi:hypothetical protein